MRHPEVLAGLLLLAFVLVRGAATLTRWDRRRGQAAAYRRYIRSARWRRTSRACLRRAGYRCQVRGCWARARHAHHASYARLGREAWGDLVAVCKPHHRRIHDRERQLRRGGLPRPAALQQATSDVVTGRLWGWAA